jgi:hypothetical protein
MRGQGGVEAGTPLMIMMIVMIMMIMYFICSCRNKNQPKAIYPKGTSHHTKLFRGPSTIGMKK